MVSLLSQLGTALVVVFGSYACLVALVIIGRVGSIFIDACKRRVKMQPNMYSVRHLADPTFSLTGYCRNELFGNLENTVMRE